MLGRDLCDAVLGEEHRATAGAALADAARGRASARRLLVRLGDGRPVPIDLRWEPLTGAAGDAAIAVSALVRPEPHPASPETPAAPWQTVLRIGATLDLRRTARELAETLVSRHGDGAGVYVLERLLVDDQTPSLTEGESRLILRRMAVHVAEGPIEELAAAFPLDEVVAYSTGSPFARSMSTRRPVVFSGLDALTMSRIKSKASALPGVARLLAYDTFLSVPLVARGDVLGFAVVARRSSGPSFTPEEIDVVRRIAAYAAVCMENGRLYDRERRTTTILQQSLLPVDLPTPPGMRIAHRYLPASQTSRLGGDWYDAIPLPGGRIALVVGDAMGHGTAAALAMSQLRTAIRILARLGLPPAELLRHLDQIAQELTTAQFATCVYAVCDPATRLLTIARAGHVPPILTHADGTSELIELPPGLPLGVGEAGFEALELRLPEASTLVLCTDGLVENRTRDLDTGLATLRGVLPGIPADLEVACDIIVKCLHSAGNTDDATLLLARITPDG